MAYGKGGFEVSFQEELLKSGLAKTQQGGVECPNQLAFENAQRMANAVWSQDKQNLRSNRDDLCQRTSFLN